jgi:hypothetical protein
VCRDPFDRDAARWEELYLGRETIGLVEELTERQRREIEYHRNRAEHHADLLSAPVHCEVISSTTRRRWNQYWEMFAFLAGQDLRDKNVLIVGCGFGEDALRIAKMAPGCSPST